MKKIKDIWNNNRIVFVLICILVICFVAIIVVASTFFLAGNDNTYGDRLNDIESYPITDEFKTTYISSIKESELVTDAKMRLSGRVFYITIEYQPDTSLDEAKSIALTSLDQFSEKNLGYYDINFILKCEASESSDGFTIMGAKNTDGKNGSIVWNNNKVVESES